MKPTIRGIVVAGNTLEEAQELYRAVATGQDVKALHDEGETFVVLSSAASDISMINPLTGADDLRVGDGLTEQMEFLSSDSEAVNINYTICTAGCQAHVLADDAEMLQHCPACASVLPELDAEQIAALSADEDDEGCEGCQVAAIASGATVEEAVANYQAMVLGESDDAQTMQCGSVLVSVAGAGAFDPYKGCASTIVQHESEYLESLASSSEELDAHHFVCASSTCDSPHVISSDDMPVFCPSCSSGLMEVEDDVQAVAGSDEDEDDGDIESLSGVSEEELDRQIEEALAGADDDEDDEDDEEEFDEDDESDEDEDEDDEDDLDDEDEDDEDLGDDEDEDEEDEDDEDDALTLSVSSVQPASRRARNREEARAAAQQEEEHEHDDVTVAVAASFIATASVQAELDASKVEVTYSALASGNKWFAFYDGVPFAVATAASAPQHAQIFNTDVFGRAFKAQASEQGVVAAVENMGFVEIKPEIQVADYVQSEINKQVEVRTQEVASAAATDKAELVDRFGAAMALAATGITKNFFKGQTNPIAQQLIESLSAVGLDNAASLVNAAFAQNSEAYHKVLLAQASNILSYGLDTQNEIAKAVNEFNHVEANASTSPVQMGRPVQVAAKDPQQEHVEANASAQPSADFNALLRGAVSGLGKR
ncbi:hypothetical protein D3C85_646650 [compost metagenome]